MQVNQASAVCFMKSNNTLQSILERQGGLVVKSPDSDPIAWGQILALLSTKHVMGGKVSNLLMPRFLICKGGYW